MHPRSHAQIHIDGDVVVKLHRAGTDPAALRQRLRVAARLGADPQGCLLAPLSVEPDRVGAGPSARWSTCWPRVDVVAPDPSTAPWCHAGSVLARLHRATIESADRVLEQGAPRRLQRALTAIRGYDSADARLIRRAADRLPAEAWLPYTADRPAALLHGDFHLGQLGRMPGEQSWRLLDIDDLGLGDPVWDLSRPAGFWAAGVMPDSDWNAFVGGYRDADGPAVPPGSDDLWDVFEVVARAAVIQSAAAGLLQGADDEFQEAMVAACARMPG